MMFSVLLVMHMIGLCYYLGLEVIGCMQLVNYCFIIQLDGCMCSFYCGDDSMMIMILFIKLVNNKVVDNLLIYPVLNFHSHKPYGLRIVAVRSLLSEMFALWTDLNN